MKDRLHKICRVCGKHNYIFLNSDVNFRCECGAIYKEINRKVTKRIEMRDMIIFEKNSNVVHL